ncbi:MAG: elongation factor 4 [Elusimicrobia bacterium]|nr:elongation factor 4 [Elusimicrobiota bacterium]
MDQSLIRNFSIIAHIDHGKSTLADRLMLFTGAIDERRFKNQLLDDMDLERERGITIKASAVRLTYKAKDGKEYLFNLIDTPGHVDFTYEVEKSLKACEGALLIVDATQGVESQTVANYYLAINNNLEILPVINKIDVASVDLAGPLHQVQDVFKFKEEDIQKVSAKEGTNIDLLFEKIVSFIPSPEGEETRPLKALVFDMKYDVYKGIIIFVRIFDGSLSEGQRIRMMHTGREFTVEELGVYTPFQERVKNLGPGEVGYLTCNVRDPHEVRVGDTITLVESPCQAPLEGYRQLKPLVFCGVYPVTADQYMDLREAIDKLRLSDPSFTYEPETSQSFGHGFRCGFLGLLHMEVVQERLEREFNLSLVLTTPNVGYRYEKKDGTLVDIENPSELPNPSEIKSIEEPYLKVSVFTPVTAMDAVMALAKKKRGVYVKSEFVSDRMRVVYEIPLAEVIVDFNDLIKSATRGYGSIDYEFCGYRTALITKMDILINDEISDAFSCLVHREHAYEKGSALCDKLKELIPPQLFEIRIQAACDGRIIAASRVKSMGKNVTAKCYGGDISRKRKLWEKQKEGKKKLKQIGKVEIPQEAFFAALKI